MPTKFASGKWAISICDRCGFRYELKELKTLTIKTKNVNILVCKECWEPDQPQLSLGLYPVDDPQALRNPRPDTSYRQAGYTGLQLTITGDEGGPSGGSRDIQWGWSPVGGASAFDDPLTPNYLAAATAVGTVTISLI